ncbi:uncharacterized protein LOC133203260 [Saccostrea echinata]|uniref:uncharacterized protein LOC133203260 n=1 Tax=Saccostrea echinata TaxID=191078 RepID=UPI002A7FA623|nr:uncharacterized protein LOC133203260 [Saccostrea echinata]
MMTPDPQLYKDLHSGQAFPGCTDSDISAFLLKFNKIMDKKARDMYNDGFIQYVKVVFHDLHWFIRSSVKASMMKSVKYIVDVMIGQDKSVVESQCECAAGMGPDAHCKHVCAVLFACSDFMKRGSVKTELTCTQMIQTFHRAKPHKGSPLKARIMDMPGCDEICNSEYDPRPLKYQNSYGYSSYFRSVCLNFPGISSTPIFQLYEPANMRALDLDHDYLKDTFSERHLKLINVSETSEESARQVMVKTATQATNDLWFEERCKRLHSSLYGRICKATDRTDKAKLAQRLTEKGQRLNTKPILHGRKYEKSTLKKYQEITGNTVYDSGICVCLDSPYLAASPDGIIDEDTVVEVKCPYVARNNFISSKTVPYVRQSGTRFYLDEKHDYYYQVQGQLLCAQKQKCIFVV